MKRKHLALAAGFAVAAITAIGGYSYWTTNGAGAGSATTGTASSIVVDQTSAATGLVPGGSVALAGTFTNGNTFPVYVGSVTAAVEDFSEQADSGKPACTEDDFSVGGAATVGAQVAPGSGGPWSGLTLSMTNSSANQDNCKDITVPVEYTANP